MSKPLYVISTHAKCYDGAAAAVILERYCLSLKLDYVMVPHVWGKSYMREFGLYLTQRPRVVILMFDVAPDEELIETLYRLHGVTLVCGDHHIGQKQYLDSLKALNHTRIQIHFDNNSSGAHLAWMWVKGAMSTPMSDLGIVMDGEGGEYSRVLHAVCMADLWRHKGDPDLEAVDASLRMLHFPDAVTMTRLLTCPGTYDTLLREGPICMRIKETMSRDLLQRGRMYRLAPQVVAMARKVGAVVPDECTVFYVQGIPHLSSEMAFMHTTADLVWIWSKIESSPYKQYTVAVRRGRASDIRCDMIALALGGGNGHAEAAGMAFDSEPFHFLTHM